jgi:hypothetical protein
MIATAMMETNNTDTSENPERAFPLPALTFFISDTP